MMCQHASMNWTAERQYESRRILLCEQTLLLCYAVALLLWWYSTLHVSHPRCTSADSRGSRTPVSLCYATEM